MSPAVASNYYIDLAAPAISGGISIPASIMAGSSFSSSGVDEWTSRRPIHSSTTRTAPVLARSFILRTSSAAGVAFDNTLARSSSITTTLPANQFYRSLNTIAAWRDQPSGKCEAGHSSVSVVLDAANNLSAPNTAHCRPRTSLRQPVSPERELDLTDFADFGHSCGRLRRHGATNATPRSATFSAVYDDRPTRPAHRSTRSASTSRA